MQVRSGCGLVQIMSLGLTLAFVACSDASGPENSSGLQVRAAAQGVDVQSGAGVEVDIDLVSIVIGRVKLEKADATPSDFVDETSVVIQLLPGAAPELVFAGDVPAGAYKELEIAVDKLEAGHPGEQPLIDQYPMLRDASILIEGTVTRGNAIDPFSFASDLDIDLELTFTPALVLDAAGGPQTLAALLLDISSWFLNDSGAVLDPEDPAARSAIEENVKRSIELFEGSVHPGG